MQAIVHAAQNEKWPAKIAAVISSRPDVDGLKFAAAQGIPTAVVSHRDFPQRVDFDAALRSVIDCFDPDVIVLAGFMRILSAGFVEHYSGRMLNIHPSLLPSFTGLHTHRQALAAGVKLHGATVHFVTADLDHGPIVHQSAVPVLDDDTEESLSARVLEQEHLIYPRAVRMFIAGQLVIEDGRVRVTQTTNSA